MSLITDGTLFTTERKTDSIKRTRTETAEEIRSQDPKEESIIPETNRGEERLYIIGFACIRFRPKGQTLELVGGCSAPDTQTKEVGGKR